VQCGSADENGASRCTNILHKLEHEMTTIGYAGVSTDGQSIQAQTEALHACGCARIFAEKISGAYSACPQLAKALAALGEGDTLMVCKLDRLARSTRDLLNTLDAIGKAAATFKSLSDPGAIPQRPTAN
jgi:DNA invertase Pin-like site-specific DNA recombinase